MEVGDVKAVFFGGVEMPVAPKGPDGDHHTEAGVAAAGELHQESMARGAVVKAAAVEGCQVGG